VLLEPNELAFNLFRLDQVVGIQELHKISGGMRQRHVERCGLTPIFLFKKLEVGSRERTHHRGASINGTVVHDNDLDLRPSLSENRFERLANVLLGIVTRDQDGDLGAIHVHPRIGSLGNASQDNPHADAA
jgi:hypothetical protein